MKYSLKRFEEAQSEYFKIALKELQAGRKETHWMWYIFPQLKGLGDSYMSNEYGIENLFEAQQYFQHPILRYRYLRLCKLLEEKDCEIHEIFDYPDDLKLKSSLTLFKYAAYPEKSSILLFQRLLDKYFNSEECEFTKNSVRNASYTIVQNVEEIIRRKT